MLTALVVPTIREASIRRFIEEWHRVGLFDQIDKFVLLEDNPKKTFSLQGIFKELFGEDAPGRPPPYQFQEFNNNTEAKFSHFCWEDIERELGENSWIIPRRSDTVRSFGYWWVWNQRGVAHDADCPRYEFLMTLDDDCYPEPGYESLSKMHEQLLTRTKWFNTLNNVRPRGTPYKNLGKRKVYVNHGLWTNVLDYDAPQQLVDPIPETFTHDNRIVPHGSFFSFCGMNWMCRREAIPLMYHMLMGKWKPVLVMDGSEDRDLLCALPFDRFGDIWCGIVMKKICDHLGWAVSSGIPYIHHDRASDPFKNLRKEANGIEVNEWLWEKIDGMYLGGCSTPLECYERIAMKIMDLGGEHGDYWVRLGSAMKLWVGLFAGGPCGE